MNAVALIGLILSNLGFTADVPVLAFTVFGV